MQEYQAIIEAGFANIENISPKDANSELGTAVEKTLAALESGELRVAEKQDSAWVVCEWAKKAVLLSFRLNKNSLLTDGMSQYFDKVALRFRPNTSNDIEDAGIRVVPGACIRQGTYIGKNTVIMPSFINIGAYIDSGCMIDTWATVGSCAQIGKNVHLSGGAGIGGVLEPLQASPTIIEDNCFIGARSEVAEGVIVEHGAVLAMGTFISQSTKIVDRETGDFHYGRVPAGAVVVPGCLPSKGGVNLNCAVIVKYVDEKTKQKTGINALLRESMGSSK